MTYYNSYDEDAAFWRADRITDEYYRTLDAQEEADYDAEVLASVRAAAAAKQAEQTEQAARAAGE